MGIKALSKNDSSSFANTEDVVVRHAHIIWLVDFKKQTLSGSVTLTMEKVNDLADKVVLDTKNISIKKATLNGDPVDFVKGQTVATFGESLTLKIDANTPKNFDLKIEYETSSNASALQWLGPGQTAGKTHPYLFSQCQSIHCRTILPCQDTPFVKFTYSAEVDADSDMTVLLSAISSSAPQVIHGTSLRRHKFEQKVTIPSYLLAIVVAKLAHRTISPRIHVWSEEQNVDAATWEFSHAEEHLKLAEELCGEYEWGRYDLLILPPSYGYGGMEHPCITFVTPTCVAGDRSQSDVVTAHEISHSWTGNSVGIKNYDHFWLNEGWTMFLQRKIEAKLYGEKHRHFSALLGLNELKYTVKDSKYPEIETTLVRNLEGIDPEDVYNNAPYEKGHTLLFYLETLLGGSDVFNPFIKAYCQHFKGQAIDTTMFLSFLYVYFDSKKSILDSVDWHAWFYGIGMPPVIPDYDTTLSEECIRLADKWLGCPEEHVDSLSSIPNFKDLSPLQQIEFLDRLLLHDQLISVNKLRKLDEWYNMKDVRNTEVKFRWLRLCIKAEWEDKIFEVIKFATSQGRMKFVRPLFRSMYAWPAAKARAVAAFKKHQQDYMYITARQVALDLNLLDL